jgi:hypothetical protein
MGFDTAARLEADIGQIFNIVNWILSTESQNTIGE